MKKKNVFRRMLDWLGWTVLGLLVALTVTVMAAFTCYRLRGPTEEQRAALALMRRDYRPAHGVNAFPLLFYMAYDVPEDRLDAQMAADVEKVRKRLADDGRLAVRFSTDAPPLSEVSLNEATRERCDHRGEMCAAFRVIARKLATVLCDLDGSSCLTKVRANPEAVSSTLAAFPITVARAQAFERTDFYWYEFPADERSPDVVDDSTPMFWLSAFALRYVRGDHVGALAQTCRNIAAWRRMARGSNALINSVPRIRMNGAIRLYADMLTGLPAHETVPEDCTLALQPVVAADVDRCAELAHRYAMFEALSQSFDASTANSGIGWLIYLYDNSRQTMAWTAQALAASCGNDATARLLADERPHRQPVRSFLGFPLTKGLACIASLNGCFIVASETPLFNSFDIDTLDHAAHLRLAATLLWLREHPDGGTTEERFEHRPAWLRSPHHASWYDAKEGMIYLDAFDESSTIKKPFALPVAPLP